MVVCAKHVDATVEAARTLVEVISQVASDVGSFAVTLDDHAVAVIAKGGRTQPDCAIRFKNVAKFAKSLDGTVYGL